MNPLLAALVQAGVLTADEAGTLARMMDNDTLRATAEQQVAAAFARAFAEQRSRLVKALDTQRVDPQTMERFWTAEERELARDVLPVLEGVAQDAALASVIRGGTLADWRTVNEAVIDWTNSHYRSAGGDALGSIPNLVQTERNAVADLVEQWQRGDLNENGRGGLPMLLRELEGAEAFGADRAARVGVTEVTRIFAEAERAQALGDENLAWLVWQTSNDELVCFPAGTLVTTPVGETPIEQIVPGQLVLTRQGAKRVVATSRRDYGGAMVTLGTEAGRQVTCTANHPVWSEIKQGWLQAMEFKPGDSVQLVNHESDRIRRAVHFSVGHADDCPTQPAQMAFLRSVSTGRMPVSAVNLDGNHLRGNRKVNAVAPDPVFLNKGDFRGNQSLADFGFQHRFALRTAVAGEGTELAVGIGGATTHALATGFARDMTGRAAAFLGAIVPIQSLLSVEHLAAAFTGNIVGFSEAAGSRAHGITVGSTGGNCEFLIADRANFRDPLGRTACLITVPTAKRTPLMKLRASDGLAALHAVANFRSANGVIARLRAIFLFLRRRVCLERLTAMDAGFRFHVPPRNGEQPTIPLYHASSATTIQVYDIQVEDVPEFYANGILVHNCEICGPLNETRIRKDEATFPGGYFPPAHPNCRCTVTAVSEWAATGENPAGEAPPVEEAGAAEYVPFGHYTEANDWAEQAYSDFTASLTKADEAIVDMYCGYGSNYRAWNSALRSGEVLDRRTQFATERLDEIISRATPGRNIVTYRGSQNVLPKDYEDLQRMVGTTITDNGYVSTSFNQFRAMGFGGADDPLMEIHIPASAKAAYLNPSESEVVLPRATNFKVVGTRLVQDYPDEPPIKVLMLEVIP